MKKFAMIFCFLMLSFSSVHAKWYYKNVDCTPFNHKLSGTYEFQADRHGQFKGDIVAVLDDSSSWKVHPKDTERFLAWKTGEKIHVGLRTTYYFFKREHKFTLYNHNRNESVFVMMISSPLFIQKAYDPQASAWIYVSGIRTSGTNYRVNLELSNGVDWEVAMDSSHLKKKKDLFFQKDTPVYVGYNIEGTFTFFFLINGTEREAVHRWGRMGNFIYDH